MRRIDFLKTSLLAGVGLNLILPQKLKTPTSVAYLTGKKNPYKNYTKSLHPKAYKAFLQMRDCALEQGINIQIVSGYRSFDRQLSIWNNKFEKFKEYSLTDAEVINKVTNYSAIPGTSRHHWGTELDIIDENSTVKSTGLLNHNNFEKNGAFYKMHKWLKENAHQFDYHIVYSKDKSRTGFMYEPWHYSYAPVSKKLLKKYSQLNLNNIIRDNRILGYKNIDENCLKSYFRTHLLGINQELLP
jgi:LAS superfamily LD-carboxypeptidase LdcB